MSSQTTSHEIHVFTLNVKKEKSIIINYAYMLGVTQLANIPNLYDNIDYFKCLSTSNKWMH